MRKTAILEIILVVVLLTFAAVICIGVSLGVFVPPAKETTPTTEATTQATTQATTEATTQATTEATTQATTQATTEETTEPVPTLPSDIEITWNTYPDRELTCTQAFVYDCQTDSYIYLIGDPEDRVWPASITKLMSIHVATQYLDPSWKLTAGSILERIPEDASTAKLEQGDVMRVDMLIQGMLMPSGNDAAYMIATEAGREIAKNAELSVDEAVAVFVEEMNRQAAQLGLTGTHYMNPDGWHDENHYTNFNDLVTVAKLALDNPLIMEYTKIPKVTVTPEVGESKEWINTNLLVNPETIYYVPYTIGLKTGQTDAAGSCLLTAFDIEGCRYIIGVFGSPTFNDKLDDTIQIFNAAIFGQ